MAIIPFTIFGVTEKRKRDKSIDPHFSKVLKIELVDRHTFAYFILECTNFSHNSDWRNKAISGSESPPRERQAGNWTAWQLALPRVVLRWGGLLTKLEKRTTRFFRKSRNYFKHIFFADKDNSPSLCSLGAEIGCPSDGTHYIRSENSNLDQEN